LPTFHHTKEANSDLTFAKNLFTNGSRLQVQPDRKNQYHKISTAEIFFVLFIYLFTTFSSSLSSSFPATSPFFMSAK
jgi:hypothetical protein